jgi:hypothetical protein
MKAQSRACPGKAEQAVAELVGKVLSMTSTAKFIQFWHLEALHAGQCAQAVTVLLVKVILAAARATPRRVFPLTLIPECSCVCTGGTRPKQNQL